MPRCQALAGEHCAACRARRATFTRRWPGRAAPKPPGAEAAPLLLPARIQPAWATPDLLAALTLLVIAVPEQLATSRLAGMPAISGFYAFVAGTVLFALLGSNPQMSVGADSTIAPSSRSPSCA